MPRIEKADKIKTWFENLEKLLQRIFADKTVHLDFDEDTFRFYILQQEKEPLVLIHYQADTRLFWILCLIL